MIKHVNLHVIRIRTLKKKLNHGLVFKKLSNYQIIIELSNLNKMLN